MSVVSLLHISGVHDIGGMGGGGEEATLTPSREIEKKRKREKRGEMGNDKT